MHDGLLNSLRPPLFFFLQGGWEDSPRLSFSKKFVTRICELRYKLISHEAVDAPFCAYSSFGVR